MNVEQTATSLGDGRRRQRRLRMILSLTSNVLRNDPTLTHREALSLVRCAEKAILDLVPGDRRNYELVILPHFERILHERWPREGCVANIRELIN